MKTQKKIRIGTLCRVALRFFAGRDLDGDYRTDHKWSKAGTQIISTHGRATRWAYQPMRRRAGVRFLLLFAVLALLVGPFISTAGTVQTLRVLAWIGMGVGAWVAYERSRKYAQRRHELLPLAEAVAHHLKDSRYIHNPREWISLPVDVQDGTTIVYLPIDYTPSATAERAFARMVGRRIGIGRDPNADFELQGERPRLELRPAPTPRDLVDFADLDVRALVENTRPGQLFLGLGPRDEPAYIDLTKTPHTGMSMATNHGKSVTARGLLMQHLHEGGIALVLDPKMDSHLWVRALPNVRYADTAQEIHEALLWLSDELDRRCEVTKVHADIRGDVDPDLVGPALMVVAEELNTIEIDVKRYWRTIRDPRNDPILPISLSALGRALNMGRARRIYALLIAQELLVQCIGGPAGKTNLSARILGRAGVPTWNKLAPECKVNGRYPRKLMRQGRVYLVVTDEPTVVQTMMVDEQTAIDYATSGTVSTFPRAVDQDPQTARPREPGEVPGYLPAAFMPAEDDDDLDEPDAVVGHVVRHEEDPLEHYSQNGPGLAVVRHIGGPPDHATLAEAIELGIYPGTLEALRRAALRPGFPPSVGVDGKAKTYDSTALTAWAVSRRGGGGDAA